MYRSPSASGGNHKVVYVRIGKGSIFVILSISLLLFIPLFFLKGIAFLDFWWWFTASVVFVLGLVFYFDRNFSLLIINDFISKWLFAFAQDEIFDNRKQTDLGKAERAFRIACSV